MYVFYYLQVVVFPRVLQKVKGINKNNVCWGDAYGDLGTIYLGEVQHHQPGFYWTNSLTNHYQACGKNRHWYWHQHHSSKQSLHVIQPHMMIHLPVFPHFFQPNSRISRINLKTKKNEKSESFHNLYRKTSTLTRWVPPKARRVDATVVVMDFWCCLAWIRFEEIPRFASKDLKVPTPTPNPGTHAICYISPPKKKAGLMKGWLTIMNHDPLVRPF